MTIGRASLGTLARRAVGGLVLALAFLPLYRALGDTAGGSSFREASVLFGELNVSLAWWGTLVTVLAAGVVAWFLPADRARRWAARAGAALARPRLPALALGAALLAGGLAWVVWAFLYQGHYTNVDEIASMVHARYLAAGQLAGTLPATPAAWVFPNTLMVEEGWVSQYPPSHLAAMALLVRLGIPGLLGPLFVAITALLLVLALPRLLPDRPVEARVGALLFALSPFVLLLGGGALSHLTAGAFLLAALYAALRARDGGAAWAVAAGAAIGLAVTSRPLQGLVLGTLFTLGVWWTARPAAGGWGWLARRCAATVAGGLPFAVALAWYNQRLFGHALTLGYSAAYGDRHGLGFHMDPWGAPYGVSEAVGFTSTDFLAIGLRLLETPLPLTAVVGVYLLTAARLPRGGRFLVAWAMLPLLANAFYWFHSTRMMYEGVPAWLALAVLGVVHLGTRPDRPAPGGAGETRRVDLGAWRADVAVWSAVVALVVAVGWGVPRLVEDHAWTDETLARLTPPELEDAGGDGDGAIVFVHAGWYERMSAVLQGEGDMRSDTIVSVLRRNSSCRVQDYAEARAAAALGDAYVGPGVSGAHGSGSRPGPEGLPELDLVQEPGMAPGVEQQSVPGMALNVRIVPGESLTGECRRQLASDRFGMVSLAPLLLRGELPGLETGRGVLYVRDLGPRRNREIMRVYPGRTPYLLAAPAADAPPRAFPYSEGERLVWGPPPAGPGADEGSGTRQAGEPAFNGPGS